MELHRREGVPEHELNALAHVALARIGLRGVVAEVGAVKHSANDLTQGEEAHDGAVGESADEKALDVRLAAAAHPLAEGCGIGRWHHPASMECPTDPVQCNNLLPVAARRLAEVDPLTHVERIVEVRFWHAPSVAEQR